MDQRTVEDLIFAKLAKQSGEDPQILRAEAEQGGSHLPFDSIMVVEILAIVADECGVDLPVTGTIAAMTGSVALLAAEIVARVAATQALNAGEGA